VLTSTGTTDQYESELVITSNWTDRSRTIGIRRGQNYYVIEQDGERLAVPAGDKPEYRPGDEITATRSAEGIELGESYGYGR